VALRATALPPARESSAIAFWIAAMLLPTASLADLNRRRVFATKSATAAPPLVAPRRLSCDIESAMSDMLRNASDLTDRNDRDDADA
jgi:hypothetical protein